ncbi:MAG: molybdopterin-dependent oxidoreductase [Chloroflexi bacterium]|nr:molybdopterin-dependent oxidoreductase [Chloroflexota bacterium]
MPSLTTGGKVNIFSVTQSPFRNQVQIVRILKKPMTLVRLISGTVGGGFGSKIDLSCDHVTALLALNTGRPVK